MLHEIAPHTFSNAYKPRRPADSDHALYFSIEGVLLSDGPSLPTFADLGGAQVYSDATYLFSMDETGFFLIDTLPPQHPDTLQMHTLQRMREVLPQQEVFAGTTAGQLYRWYRDTRYCGRCGMRTKLSETERAVVCACGYTCYPKIAPAIIVAVSDGKRLLMTRNTRSTYSRYALVAGFVEIGETFEQTVAREVMEEVGLRVKNIRYYKNQPWGVSDNVMIGFFADLDGDDTITLNDGELTEAVWFEPADIPQPVTRQSIAQELIETVRERLASAQTGAEAEEASCQPRLRCINIAAHNPTALAEFYRDALGAVTDHTKGDPDRVEVRFCYEDEVLVVLQQDARQHENEAPKRHEFELHVVDVDAEYDRLCGFGIEIERPPADLPWGFRYLRFVDPEGNGIDLVAKKPAD